MNLQLFTLEERAELSALMAQFRDLKERVRVRLMASAGQGRTNP
jgi:hypothetical protein